jgi:hypothetical protein
MAPIFEFQLSGMIKGMRPRVDLAVLEQPKVDMITFAIFKSWKDGAISWVD